MPSFYSGNPAHITPRSLLAALAVTGATNASPIVISTGVNHMYNTGDLVLVGLVAGNTAANGTWQVTVLTATTFQLNGSYGNGSYTSATGLTLDVSMNPPYQIPSDGDAFNAAAFNTAFEALGDRTQYIQNQLPVGSFTPITTLYTGTADDTWTTWSTTTIGSSGWDALTNTLDLFNYASNLTTCNTGDLITVVANVTGTVSGGVAMAFAPGIKVPGSTSNADYTEGFGAGQQFQSGANTGIQMQANFSINSGGSNATMTAYSSPLVTIGGITGGSASLVGSWLSIIGAANPANNGTFYVHASTTSTTCVIVNPNAVYPDANSGNLDWQFNNMPLIAAIMGSGNGGTMTLRGHRSFLLTQYRQVTTYGTIYPLGPVPLIL
jgi:hypothetical protein